MIIEQVEALKTWLTNKLSPICDAEPSALAKYVCALVKKDKPEQELRDICVDQLDVFLQQNTRPFVDELFEVLKSKVYIPPAGEVKPRPPVVIPLVKHENKSPSHHGGKEKDDGQKKKISEISSTTDDKENKDSLVSAANFSSVTITSNALSSSRDSVVDSLSRISKDPPREVREPRDITREVREPRDFMREVREPRDFTREVKEPRDITRDVREPRGDFAREVKEPRDITKDAREPREITRDNRDLRDVKEPRDIPRDTRATSRDGRDRDRDEESSRDRRDSWRDDKNKEGIRDARDIIRENREKERDRTDTKQDTREVREPRDSFRDRDRDYRRRRTRSRSFSPRRRDFDLDRRRRFEDRSRYSPDRRWRRRSWSRSPRRNRSPLDRNLGRQRSRSPRVRSRSPRYRPYRSRTRSRTRSPRPRSWSRPGSGARLRTRSPSNVRLPDSRGSTPLQDNDFISSSTNDLATVSSTVGFRPSAEKRIDNRLPQPYDAPPSSFLPSSRGHCKNFEEKGFCMLGDVCPYDHGSDPVVLEDMSIPTVIPGSTSAAGMPSSGTFVPPDMRIPPPGHMGMRVNLQQQPLIHVEPYMPEAPGLQRLPFMRVPMPDLHRPPPGMLLNRPPHPNPIFMPGREVIMNRPSLQIEEEGFSAARPDTEPSRIVIPAKRPYAAIDGDPKAINIGPPPPRIAHTGQLNPPFEALPPPQQPFQPQVQPAPRFDYSRLGVHGKFTRPRPPFKPGNLTLEVRKIPHELNNIAKLNEHFGKFGNLTNIQVKFQGDPGAAVITFSNTSEANAAYRSPEPVFNNRFIKLFWHTPEKQINLDGETESPVVVTVGEETRDVRLQQTSVTGGRVGDGIDHPSLMLPVRPSIPPAHKLQLDNTKAKPSNPTTVSSESSVVSTSQSKAIVYTSSVGNLKKTIFNQLATPATTTPTASRTGSPFISPTAVKTADHVSRLEAISRAEEEKKLAAIKQVQLEHKKQELLAKQIQQQKILLDTLEKRKATMSEEEKKDLWKALRTISDAIDKVKYGTGVKKAQPAAFQPTVVDHFKYSSVHEQQPVPYGRGRGWPGARTIGWAPRGRGMVHHVNRTHLDNRPKTVEVKGFDLSELEEIKHHFQRFGEIGKTELVEEVPSVFFTFNTRPAAEAAVAQGGKFKKKTLIVRWNQIIPKIIRTESTQSSEVDEDLSVTLGSLNEDSSPDAGGDNKSEKLSSLLNPEAPQEEDKDSRVFEPETLRETPVTHSHKPVFERSLSEDLLATGEENFKASYTDDEDEEDHITVTLSNTPSSSRLLYTSESYASLASQDRSSDIVLDEDQNFDSSALDYNDDINWS